MAKEPEIYGPDEAPTPLATLGDVKRALAKTIRRIESGYFGHQVGQVMINGLGTLAKVMQDQRDSMWTKRAAVLWEERKARTEPNGISTENH